MAACPCGASIDEDAVSSRHLEVEHAIPGEYQLRALREGRRFQRAWHRARLDLVECLLPPVADGLVLDAAAGSGIVTWHFRAPRIVSTDLRTSACAAIRSHTPRARVASALLDALPFRSGTFTRIYLLEVIEHLDAAEGRRALRELHRVARPGAACLVTTPNHRSYWPLLERLLDVSGLTPEMGDGQHVSRYTGGSLRRSLEASGWTVQRTGSFNLLAPVAGTLSERAGTMAIGLEVSALPAGGPLLYAVCRRDG